MTKKEEQKKTPAAPVTQKKKTSIFVKGLRGLIVILIVGILYLYTFPLYQEKPLSRSARTYPKEMTAPVSAPDAPVATPNVEPVPPALDLPEPTSEPIASPTAACGYQNGIVQQTVALYGLINRGEPFANALDELLEQDPQNPFALAIEENLSDFKMTGVPTLPLLQARFKQAANEARLSFHIKQNMTWQAETIAFLKSLVQVRPLTITNARGVNILYKAEDALNAGHIEEAMMTLALLPPPQAFIMQDFMREAAGRIIINNIAQTMTSTKGENK